MEIGDIIGPWIFEDLQKAFITIKWTLESYTDLDKERRIAGATEPTRAATIAAHDIAWAAASWGAAASSADAYVAVARGWASSPNQTADSARNRADIIKSNITTHIAHAADLYVRPRQIIFDSTLILGFGRPDFNSMDYGMVENGMFLWESFGSAATDERISTIGDIDTAPLHDAGLPNPWAGGFGGDYEGIEVANSTAAIKFVMKWDFTFDSVV